MLMSKTTTSGKGRKCQKVFKLLINCIPKLEIYWMGRTTNSSLDKKAFSEALRLG